jgi:hypothetical protein
MKQREKMLTFTRLNFMRAAVSLLSEDARKSCVQDEILKGGEVGKGVRLTVIATSSSNRQLV